MPRTFAMALFFAVPAFAQPSIELYSGVNFPYSPFHEVDEFFLKDFWMVGINGGINAQFHVADWLVLSPGFEYSHYPFSHFFQWVSTAERRVQSSSGQSSHIYRVPFTVRLFDTSKGFVIPYISLGGEYVFENIGRIHIIWQNQDGTNSVSDIEGPDRSYWAYSVGIGTVIQISTHIDLDPSLKYHSNTTDRFYMSFNLGVLYTFE